MDTSGRMSLYEDYVSFETAKLLKEKGFDGKCSCYYFSNDEVQFEEGLTHWNWNDGYYTFRYSAPTLQMTMKWLREKHIVIIPEVETFYADGSVSSWEYHIWCDDNYEEEQHSFSSYEEAAEAAIKYCLENLI